MSNKAPITGFKSLSSASAKQTAALQNGVIDQGIEIVETENLGLFDGNPGYKLAQGQ